MIKQIFTNMNLLFYDNQIDTKILSFIMHNAG